jgi:hypothetical protein
MSKPDPSSGQRSPKVQHLNETLRRKRETRELNRRILIVCEDEKSAPHYFRAMIHHFRLSASKVTVVGSDDHTQPIQIVDRAIDLKKAADKEARSKGGKFDEVWCVIDGDYGAKIANARSRAEANQIKLAISTMCFEFWLILHFVEFGKPTDDCAKLNKHLRKHWLAYDKGKADFKEIVAKATEAAERSRRIRMKDTLPEKQNPCSDLHLLLDSLGLTGTGDGAQR